MDSFGKVVELMLPTPPVYWRLVISHFSNNRHNKPTLMKTTVKIHCDVERLVPSKGLVLDLNTQPFLRLFWRFNCLSPSSTHVHVNPRPTVSEKWLSVYWLESPILVNLCSIISIITTEEWGKRKTTRNKGFSMISNLFIYFWTFLDQDYQYS